MSPDHIHGRKEGETDESPEKFDTHRHNRVQLTAWQNGICERFHKTILQEFYQITFRKKIYQTIEELQADLDEWIDHYNQERPHSGRFCYGKTPTQTFQESKHLAKEKMLDLTMQTVS